MIRLLAAAVVVLALVGCDAARPVDFGSLSHDPAALVGTWDLDRSWSYWTGRRAEDLPGDAETWTFAADGRALHVTASGAHSARDEVHYEVVAEPGQTPHLVLGTGTYWFGLDRGRLILQARGVGDAPEDVYRRRR